MHMMDDFFFPRGLLKNECLTYQPQSLSESNPNEEKYSVEGDTPHPPMKQHIIT